MNILTGIDLPLDLVCGSLILAGDLYPEIARRGHEVTFLGLPPGSGKGLVLGARALNIVKSEDSDATYLARLEAEVRTVCEEVRPDLVHVHHLGYGMAQALLAIPSEIPKVGFAHGTDIYDARTDTTLRDLASAVARQCQTLIFPSVSLLREALESGIDIDCRKVCIVPWGISGTLSSALEMKEEPPYAVFAASRLTANKDVVSVVRAISLLPDIYSLTVFGEGREAENISTVIEECQVGDRVTIATPLPRQILWQKMAEFNCAVFPTRDTEAFGLIGVECQAQGLPLITSSIPVFEEVFGRSAARFATGDPSSLARTIESVCEDRSQSRLLRGLGWANAARYSFRRTCDLIESISANRL